MNKQYKQRGVALFITLIMLVAMTIASIALVRTVDTANVVAGNLAFKQSTLQIGDMGIEAAATALQSPILTTASETTWSLSGSCTSDACRNYHPTMLRTNSIGVPTNLYTWPASGPAVGTAILWDSVPAISSNSIPAGYQIQYVIDRLCHGPAPVTDIAGKCMAEMPLTEGGEKGVSGRPVTKFTSSDTVYYRVTVRVRGPRSTETFIQSILTGPPDF